MLRYKKMLIVLGILLTIGSLWYLVLKRHINPDNLFIRRFEPISFNRLYVHDYKGSFMVIAEIGGNYRTSKDGKGQYSINDGYTLYDDEYTFRVDNDDNFVLEHITSQKAFILGKVEAKEHIEYDGTLLYTIEILEGYTANFTHAEGIFPYYEPVRLTMMSSGGMKYSSENCTLVLAPNGDRLQLCNSYGHIHSDKKSGIFKVQ